MPLFPEVGVLGLPYHTWGTHWMTPHHVLPRLATYFNVLWLDPQHHWREIASLGRRRRAATQLPSAFPAGFAVLPTTAWTPDVYRPAWLRARLFRRRLSSGWNRLRAEGCRKLVLYVWHPRFEPAVAARGYDLSLYHIDDEYSFSPELPPMSGAERRVIAAVDHVLAISPGLMERKGGINPSTIFAPEGVDFELYATPVEQPHDLARIPRPCVGYTGVLKRQLDWPLLRELARRRPDWSFVFVGPVHLPPDGRAILDEMATLKNVHLLGAKTARELAAYPQHFDVCIMPYRVDGYTNNIYPLKLHEYLASGRPIVGSPIRSLQEFGEVLALAESVDPWLAALETALAPAAARASVVAARREVARTHDWSVIIRRIAGTICQGLGEDYPARLDRIGPPGRAGAPRAELVAAPSAARR